MRCGLIAKKIGMTRICGDDGQSVPVSVLKMDNCQVISKKTNDVHGYNAVQIGFGTKKAKNIRADSLYADFCDDVLVPNLYLFDVNNLISNFNDHDLTLIYHSVYKEYDHAGGKNKPGISLCFQKISSNKNIKSNFRLRCVDQLNDIDYKESYIIQNNLLLNYILKIKIKLIQKQNLNFV